VRKRRDGFAGSRRPASTTIRAAPRTRPCPTLRTSTTSRSSADSTRSRSGPSSATTAAARGPPARTAARNRAEHLGLQQRPEPLHERPL